MKRDPIPPLSPSFMSNVIFYSKYNISVHFIGAYEWKNVTFTLVLLTLIIKNCNVVHYTNDYTECLFIFHLVIQFFESLCLDDVTSILRTFSAHNKVCLHFSISCYTKYFRLV